MKKILTMTLCIAAVGSMSAQKFAVDQAAKLTGKIDKIGEVRTLIGQAAENPETKDDVRTYYTLGKAEYAAFDEAYKKLAVNPNDPAVNIPAMTEQLINGYNAFLKALPLDTVIDAKGKTQAKNSKDMVSKMSGHHNDYWQMGGELYNRKDFYPGAYQAFMIFGDMPAHTWADKNLKAVPDTTRALAYYYAGLAGYSSNKKQEAIKAFEKARAAGIRDVNCYVYEIASWQALVNEDPALEETSKVEIEKIARDGYNRYGISNPLFLNNLVNSLIQQQRVDDAVALIGNQISKTPNEPFLYGLRAYVYDRKGDDEASLNDYRKAVSFDNADLETLKNASKKIYTQGTVIWNGIEGKEPEKRNDVKVNYFEQAKAIAERAQKLAPNDSSVAYILDNINYALETYF